MVANQYYGFSNMGLPDLGCKIKLCQSINGHMSGSRDDRNRAIEDIALKAGIEKLVLQENQIVCDDEWTDERERLAQEHLTKDTSTIPEFWQNKYEKEAAKNWDKFYKRNSTNFYKDRHYLHLVFPDLGQSSLDDTCITLLEVGSGVGNAALPLLEINPSLRIIAIDFAASAIDLLKTQPLYNPERVAASVCDITIDPIPRPLQVFHNSSDEGVDFALILFCLSAISPAKMPSALSNVVSALKPGGKVFFRDYGRYDQAQLRFKSGHKLMENFYVRQDNTRAYYFDLDELRTLMDDAGLLVLELEYIRRQYVNRQQNVVRFRVWVHGIFQKRETEDVEI